MAFYKKKNNNKQSLVWYIYIQYKCGWACCFEFKKKKKEVLSYQIYDKNHFLHQSFDFWLYCLTGILKE